jgi:hypothetical protein
MVAGLDARDILWAWESAHAASAGRRALVLWQAGVPDRDRRELADEPLGRCTEALLRIRWATFGPTLELFVECPSCDAELEFELDARDVLARAEDARPGETLELEIDSIALQARSPTHADLLALEQFSAVEDARRALITRCVSGAVRRGDELDAGGLPSDVVARLADALRSHDPLAEVVEELACPMCSHEWEATLDTADFLWREVEVEARRLLRQIDSLARAYGWTEPQILALSPFRRRRYLELINP